MILTGFFVYLLQYVEDYQERYSLLWERIESLFTDALKARYAELRKSVYSFGNIVSKFEQLTDLIGTDLYKEDVEIYSNLSEIPVHIFDGSSVDLGSICGKPFTVSVLVIQEPGDSNILELKE